MFLLIKGHFVISSFDWMSWHSSFKLHVHFFPSHEPFVIRYFKVPHFSEFESVKQNL